MPCFFNTNFLINMTDENHIDCSFDICQALCRTIKRFARDFSEGFEGVQ